MDWLGSHRTWLAKNSTTLCGKEEATRRGSAWGPPFVWFLKRLGSKGILAVLILGAGAVYVAALTPDSFGFYHDDGIYVTAAKSLATGQGYKIISLPGEPVETKSPPLYPFLLSLVWRLDPGFPGNLRPMMFLSVLAGMASLALAWLYLKKRGYASSWQALLVVALVALNWRTVILASGVYSELFYTALSLGALYLTEEYEDRQDRWTSGVPAGLVLGLAFLTRTSGITLVVAVGAYFFLRRKFRMAALPLGIAAIFIFGWVSWCYFNRTHDQGVNAGYYESYFQTLVHVIREAQGSSHSSVVRVISRMAAWNVFMLVPVSIPIVCTGLGYDWIRNFGTPGQVLGFVLFIIVMIITAAGFFRLRARVGSMNLMQIYVVAYLALQVAWPYSGYDRFLMPLVPFLLLFLIVGFAHPMHLVLRELSQSGIANRISAGIVGLVLIALTASCMCAYSYGLYDYLANSRSTWTARATEDLEAMQWVDANTNRSDVIMSYRDALCYLYTDRKATFACPLLVGGIMAPEPDNLNEQTKTIFQIIAENNARYLILTPIDLEAKYDAYLYRRAYKVLLDENPDIFAAVFKSADGATVYRIKTTPQ